MAFSLFLRLCLTTQRQFNPACCQGESAQRAHNSELVKSVWAGLHVDMETTPLSGQLLSAHRTHKRPACTSLNPAAQRALTRHSKLSVAEMSKIKTSPERAVSYAIVIYRASDNQVVSKITPTNLLCDLCMHKLQK